MIGVLISTMANRVDNLSESHFPTDAGIQYFIIIQGCAAGEEKVIRDRVSEKMSSALVFFLDKKGLANNRNHCLEIACSYNELEYVYIADDDIKVNISEVKSLAERMRVDCVDLGAGRVSTPAGWFKNYTVNEYDINIIQAAKISSVEIIIKIDFIKNNNIRFDSLFGLGSYYPSGEEFIFVSDVLRAKGKARFYPITLCEHPPVSSGKDFFTNNEKIEAKGAMLYRVFGVYGYMYMFVFALKKYSKYRREISFLKFNYFLIKGSLKYKSIIIK
ncbi:hypothetical protein ABQ366_17805 [Serratia fonticola]|uniref:hypothetical protein n=1 Tax=Serratia fonticola TaxID=47917 RepID=UPI003AB0FA3F